MLAAIAGLLCVGAVYLISRLSAADAGGGGAPALVGKVDSTDAPPPLNINPEIKKNNPANAFSSNSGAVIQRADPMTGLLKQEFAYKTLTPLEGGVFDLVEPRARLYQSASSVVELQADAGQFTIPDNSFPQSGQFRKNLRITLFRAPAGKPLDLSDKSPQIALRIFLDDAFFDATLNKIESAGPVRLLNDEIDFRGQGLTMVVNDLDRRKPIEYLQVAAGHSLKFTPRPGRGILGGAGPAPKDPAIAGKAPQPDAPPAALEPQFYKITIEKELQVLGQGMEMNAESALAYFSFDALDSPLSDKPKPPAAAAPPPPPARNDPARKPKPAEESGPIEMTWKGKLTLLPLKERPAELRAEPGDLFLRLDAAPDRPVSIVSTRDPRQRISITSDHLTFQQLDRILNVNGSARHPLVIRSPLVGVIESPSLSLNLLTNQGRLGGPGFINGPKVEPAPAAPAAAAKQGLPPGLSIRWLDGADFILADTPTGKALSDIQFAGGVEVADDKFKLSSRRLHPIFTKPGANDTPQLSALDAQGDVRISMDQTKVRAESLRVEMEAQPGSDPQPRRIIASGGVHVDDPDQQVYAGKVLVLLAASTRPPKPVNPANPGNPAPRPAAGLDRFGGAIEPRHITAEGDVHLILGKEKDSEIWADKLVADVPSNTATLYGTLKKPVVVLRYLPQPEMKRIQQTELRVATLNIRRIILPSKREGAVIWTDGPGELTHKEPPDPAKPDQPLRDLIVRWNKSMRFSDETQRVDVEGNVLVESVESPLEVNNFQAKKMTLLLVDPHAVAGVSVKELTGDKRLLKEILAEGDVMVLATRYEDAARTKRLTSMQVKAPRLDFKNAERKASFIGPGSMLIEDYRPENDRDPLVRPGVGAAPATPPLVKAPDDSLDKRGYQFSGRGSTLFTWTRSMVIEGERGVIEFLGDVKMVHKPYQKERYITLTTQRLRASMRETRAIAAARMTDMKSMEIDNIEAFDGVEIKDGDMQVTAHELAYDGKTEIVALRSIPPRKVVIVDLTKPEPIKASEVLWNRKEGKFELLDVNR